VGPGAAAAPSLAEFMPLDREGSVPLIAAGMPVWVGIPTPCEFAHGALVPPGGITPPALSAWWDRRGWAAGAVGSRSHLKRPPKWKCWTTGNFERTSTLYILIIP
jgi:hypothetical protein